jgi:hypothetical protein
MQLQVLTMEEDENVVYELSCLASNIKKEVVQVLDYFLSFLKKFDKRKTHNMFSLMLNPRFKTFRLVSSLIGYEQGKAIVDEYNKGVLLIKVSKRIKVWISLK